MALEILGAIRDIETRATGRGVHIRRFLERVYGKGRWRKMKGTATVKLADVRSLKPRSIGSKHMALDARISKSRR